MSSGRDVLRQVQLQLGLTAYLAALVSCVSARQGNKQATSCWLPPALWDGPKSGLQ